MKILLVEDSDADALRLKRSIQRSSENPPHFARALDLAEGIRRCATEAYDIVLLDINLPDSEGIETIERFMAERFEKRPAVVVLTAEDDEELASKALDLGIEDYLVKGEVAPRPIHRLLRHTAQRHHLSQMERLAEELGDPIRKIGEEASALADAMDDAGVAKRLRGLARDAAQITEKLDSLRR